MSDEDRDATPEDQGEDLEVAPAADDQDAYPSLELTQLTESEHGGTDWLLDDE